MRYSKIWQALAGVPWAIQPEKLSAIIALLQLRTDGGQVPQAEIDAVVAARQKATSTTSRSVAVLPMVGVLSQRQDMIVESSGGTSTDRWAEDFTALVANADVSAIVLDIDSPGGSVFGIKELADTIFAARGTKPVIAVANSLAASGAYWLATQADQLVITPGGEVGSVGVRAVHVDYSGQNEQLGVTVSYIYAGQYKVEGNPDAPLDDDAREYMQQQVNAYYDMFVADVARGRGIRPATVAKDFGQGRVVLAKDAVAANMADRIDTLKGTVARLVQGRIAKRRAAQAWKRRLLAAQKN